MTKVDGRRWAGVGERWADSLAWAAWIEPMIGR